MQIIKKLMSFIFFLILGFFLCNIIDCRGVKNYYDPTQAKVIIIGATSGIGEATAREFARRGYSVGITGRRTERLEALKRELGSRVYIQSMDISKAEEARRSLQDLIHRMNGVDIVMLNAATGNTDLTWEQQKKIIDVNVVGFVAMASVATDYFLQKGKGHIVGVSSIAGLRGISSAPAYSASKSFVSNYLDGLRLRFKKDKLLIHVTEIQPGLVGSDASDAQSDWSVMDQSSSNLITYVRATPEKAAIQICNAIEDQVDHVYITKRWKPIAWIFKLLPDFLFNKFA